MNSVNLVGRLTRDPELRYTANGTATCGFTIAIDRPVKEKEADFPSIVAWRQLAEICASNLKKGRLVSVTGRLQTRNYDNNEGKKIFVTEVVADNVRFLDYAKDAEKQPSADPVFEGSKPVQYDPDDLPF